MFREGRHKWIDASRTVIGNGIQGLRLTLTEALLSSNPPAEIRQTFVVLLGYGYISSSLQSGEVEKRSLEPCKALSNCESSRHQNQSMRQNGSNRPVPPMYFYLRWWRQHTKVPNPGKTRLPLLVRPFCLKRSTAVASCWFHLLKLLSL